MNILGLPPLHGCIYSLCNKKYDITPVAKNIMYGLLYFANTYVNTLPIIAIIIPASIAETNIICTKKIIWYYNDSRFIFD